MNEQEIEEMLGAYALDAVELFEKEAIEAHLATCPRCRAEVASYREVTSLLANSGMEAPTDLWDRIATSLAPEATGLSPDTERLIARLPETRTSPPRRPRFSVGALAAAAAVAAIALLSVQVVHLNGKVQTGEQGQGAISAAATASLTHRHRTVVLVSRTTNRRASISITPGGTTFWLSSNLAKLPTSETYQLWTELRNGAIVSIATIGTNPRVSSVFHLEPNVQQLMVTVEPEGGTAEPTTPVLLSAPL